LINKIPKIFYDMINMWTFLVGCCRRSSCWKFILKLFFSWRNAGWSNGKNFESDNADDYNAEFEDGLDEDDLDMFEGDDSFEDYGFEEN
jgi:hypothetical protein